MKKGKVYLVGAGCGDYDLVTVRGLNLIKQCDVLIYDSLTDPKFQEIAPADAEKICVGKRAGKHSETQENINLLLVEKAKQGRTVVRLKGGDPFVFGRGGEEIIALQKHNIEYSVVPGISSAIAVPELAGIPVTHRNLSRSFSVITGHTAQGVLPENIGEYAKLSGTLIFLMALNNLEDIANTLIKNGKDENTPVAVISNGAHAEQQTVRGTLKNIEKAARTLKPPAVVVIGETANFDFSPPAPLKNISVTVTGTKRFVDKLCADLADLGADIHRLDFLEISEYADNPEFDNAVRNLSDYQWLVLTSVNGAEVFFNRLVKNSIDIRMLSGLKIAVIGDGTAQVFIKRGIFPELIPNVFTSEALGNSIAAAVQSSDKVLILRAENGSKRLTEALDRLDIYYDDIKTYNVRRGMVSVLNKVVDTDFITFASSSAVEMFFENGFTFSPHTKAVCIGSITASALHKHMKNFLIAKASTAQGLTAAILREVQNEQIKTSQDNSSDSKNGP